MRAEGLRPSPLGILMHPQYGLWHAYRGALLFDVDVSIEAPRAVIHLCDLCDGKPCLKSCPVGAYSQTGFAYQDCLGHVRERMARRAATAAASTATPVRTARNIAIPRMCRHSTWRRSRADLWRGRALFAASRRSVHLGTCRPEVHRLLSRHEPASRKQHHETRHRNPDRRWRRQGRAFPSRWRRRGQGGDHRLHGCVRSKAGARRHGRTSGERGLCSAGSRSLLSQRRLMGRSMPRRHSPKRRRAPR